MEKTNQLIDEFLQQTMIGFLSTLNKDGSPNTMPLWYEWDGERILMFSETETGKIRRLRRDPRAALCVAAGVGVTEAWASVEGNVDIVDDLEQTRAFACQLAERYYEPARAQKTIEAWSKAEDMVLLEMKPTRIRSIWGSYNQG